MLNFTVNPLKLRQFRTFRKMPRNQRLLHKPINSRISLRPLLSRPFAFASRASSFEKKVPPVGPRNTRNTNVLPPLPPRTKREANIESFEIYIDERRMARPRTSTCPGQGIKKNGVSPIGGACVSRIFSE